MPAISLKICEVYKLKLLAVLTLLIAKSRPDDSKVCNLKITRPC